MFQRGSFSYKKGSKREFFYVKFEDFFYLFHNMILYAPGEAATNMVETQLQLTILKHQKFYASISTNIVHYFLGKS